MQKSQLPISIYGGSQQKDSPMQTSYQSTECVLYGSIFNNQKSQIIERLKGLCDPGGPVPFFEHNMVFKLSII
jgi:hypothetical protein